MHPPRPRLMVAALRFQILLSPPVGSPEPPALPLCKAMILERRMSWPAVSRDTSVPPTVTSGAPGVKAVPPMEVLSGVAVMTWPPIVVIIRSSDPH